MNSNFIIVATFSLPHEMEMAKLLLESHGISCITQDELTVQSYHFISNAVGGVKLLVAPEKIELARQILIDNQIVPVSNIPDKPTTEEQLADQLNLFTSFIKKFRISPKLLFFVTLGLIIFYFVS